MEPRQAYVRRADIPADLLLQLNAGILETRTLAEGLMVDFRQLMAAVAPELPARDTLSLDPQLGITQRMQRAGEMLAGRFDPGEMTRCLEHRSDTVRGWAAYWIAALPHLTLRERLDRMRPLADDPHFGVREWAWIAVRNAVAVELPSALKLLMKWTKSRSANIRRFACEITRPRGVWCAHIGILKEDPSPAEPLLEALRADPARYVQDSVANWLNDAGKTRPDWVRDLCQRWLLESDGPATQYICRRGLRSLTDSSQTTKSISKKKTPRKKK